MYQTVITPLDPASQEIVMAQIMEDNMIEGFEQEDDILMIYHNDMMDFNFLLEKHNVNITVKELENKNWNAIWESNFEPIVIDDFCTLRAKFHEIDANTTHDILITPKMSFGTGHHATTYQVIEAMRTIDFNNTVVCDYGTGTGVLAILAEKLGATQIDAIDNDDWSIENTHENIAANYCEKISVIKNFTIDDTKSYNVVLANINKNILLQHMQTISNVLKTEGVLILSGILENDEVDLRKSIENNNLIINKISNKEGWLCIVCSKNRFQFI